MLLINYYKGRVAMINLGDHLKVKQAYKKPGRFWANNFSVNSCLVPVSYFTKRIRFLPPLVFA